MLKEIYHKLEKARARYNNQDMFAGDTYGQISAEGTERLIKIFSESFQDPQGVFYDLGCGPGHMVMHIALATSLNKSVGIELHEARYNLGIETLNKLKTKYKDKAFDKVEIRMEDLNDTDLSDATIIYVDNTVFRKKVSDLIYQKAPKGCLLISARQFSAVKEYPARTKMISRNYNNNGVWWTIK